MNKNSVIDYFVQQSLEQDDAQFKDAKKMTSYTDGVKNLAVEIHSQGLIDEFAELLTHINPQVVINAAHYLLSFKEAEAKLALSKIIANGWRPYNYLAKFTLRQWEEGNAKLYQSKLFSLDSLEKKLPR